MAYFLNERDRAIVAEVIKRVGAGAGNHRPIPRRRRQVSPAAAVSTKPAMALVTTAVSAAFINGEEMFVTPGVSTVASAHILEHSQLEDGGYKLTVKQEDDTSGPAPPEGQPWPQKDVTRFVINYTASTIGGSTARPKLCHGYLQTLKVADEEKQFFAVTEFVRNSVLSGFTEAAVNGTDFSAKQYSIQSGTWPLDDTVSVNVNPIAFDNDFRFEIPSGGQFWAVQTDIGRWVVIQAECPI